MFDLSRLLGRYPRSMFLLDTAIGAAVCGIVAAALSLVIDNFMAHFPGKPLLPLLFIVVLVAAALRYGVLSAILGAALATVIFAYFLFVPVGSFAVKKGEARNNLAWMVVVGIPAAYFAWSTKVDAQQQSRDRIKKLPPNLNADGQ
jgi:K+-sensing histidine kinase KdpD